MILLVSNVQRSSWKAIVEEILVFSGFVMAILLTNYALNSVPNVKLFDFLVFSAGYLLGFRRGAGIAVTSWYIYGQANPWGSVSFDLLVTLMASEMIYAAAGAFCRHQLNKNQTALRFPKTAMYFLLSAIICTTLYDLFTNIHTGLIWASLSGSGNHARWILTSVLGYGALIFYALHLLSNAIIFTTLGPVLLKKITIVNRP